MPLVEADDASAGLPQRSPLTSRGMTAFLRSESGEASTGSFASATGEFGVSWRPFSSRVLADDLPERPRRSRRADLRQACLLLDLLARQQLGIRRVPNHGAMWIGEEVLFGHLLEVSGVCLQACPNGGKGVFECKCEQ